ncbi:MAG: hypothetical protein GJ680_06825 [Alteromonadaceae bacterium]|nr:hypothetical protein [Alteromonadaceae bacterium]
MRKLTLLLATILMVATTDAREFEIDAKGKARGLVKSLFTKLHATKVDKSIAYLALKGRVDRAQCTVMRLKDDDMYAFEIIKLAVTLNHPIDVTFSYAADDQNKDCEVQSVRMVMR